jgi:hypothetical protein
MKQVKITFIILFASLSIGSIGQTLERKSNISVGGGSQGYKGDLGSVWFNVEEEWYGFAAIHFNRYLSKSFDFSSSITFGDYGHCRESDESRYRPDGTEVLNMLGRLTSLVAAGKYKFDNGYLLEEKARIAPYIYWGVGVNNISEHWWEDKTRANTGYFGSFHGGAGARYNFTDRFNFTYNVGFGYFTTDNVDKRDEGANDMLMQHSLMFGLNF